MYYSYEYTMSTLYNQRYSYMFPIKQQLLQ